MQLIITHDNSIILGDGTVHGFHSLIHVGIDINQRFQMDVFNLNT